MLLVLSALLGACGGDDYQPEYDRDYTLTGIGLDGPLANAQVAVYALLDNATHQVAYQATEPGTPVIETTTNDNAVIESVLLKGAANPPYILEFTSTDETLDLTTGAPPVISVVRTLVTQEMLAVRSPLYASPLTTLAVDMALHDVGVGASAEDFDAALEQSTSRVKSTLGFGMDASLDIFTTPPVLGDEVDASDSVRLQQVLLYRSAIESVRVLVQQLSEQVGAEGGTVLDVIGQDLADGAIDGQVGGERASIYATDEALTSALSLFAQPPSALCVVMQSESCVVTVADLNEFLVTERETIGLGGGQTTVIAPLSLDTPRLDTDSDDDGVNNDQDAFPDDPQESADTDKDAVGDNADNCPGLANPEQSDSDRDGIGDPCDPATDLADADDDGVPDIRDNCPSTSNPAQLDTDHDESGNVCDLDDDNDEAPDESDNCPLVQNADQLDVDGDTQGDECDNDDDNDGLSDQQERIRGSATENPDTDGDGALDGDDNCPVDFSDDFTDTDSDDYGDICDIDDDGDTVLDDIDNCSLLINANQQDTDTDGVGNACDEDDDEDGVPDIEDRFPLDGLESADTDGDGIGDNSDNCVDTSNRLQVDTDSDGAGNACDDDDDNDGLLDEDERLAGSNPLLVDSDRDGVDDPFDNCIIRANASQLDSDFDGLGDVCDPN